MSRSSEALFYLVAKHMAKRLILILDLIEKIYLILVSG